MYNRYDAYKKPTKQVFKIGSLKFYSYQEVADHYKINTKKVSLMLKKKITPDNQIIQVLYLDRN